VLNRIVDVGFLVDMCVCFRVSYINKGTQVYETNVSKVRMHYVTTWFPLDAVSLIPWDVIAMVKQGTGNMKVLRVSRVYRLLQAS
jgi:hypothetical protein